MSLTPLEIMTRLVAFPSVSRESNLDLVDWVTGFLADAGIESHRVPNAEGTKAAIYAHVGPMIDGGVVLSGHTDVVPVDGQNWTSDPFVVTQRDGRLFGRGTCDMKGFDALALWAMVQAASAHAAGHLRRPLQIALSYDEEVGCTGAPPMIDHMISNGMPRALAVIVGEPSMLEVVTGHKGGVGWWVDVTGHEVHSSMPHVGVNAIMWGAKLIEWCNQVNADNQAKTAGPLAAAFVPPWTGAHVGTIAGGTAHNITAGHCHFAVTFRVVPGEKVEDWLAACKAKADDLTAQMQAVHPGAGFHLRPMFRVPALVPEDQGPAEELCRRLTGDNASHVVSYGTEAGQFQEVGYSVVVCGPGSIEQAHQADEYISVDQFEAGQAFMQRLIQSLCQP